MQNEHTVSRLMRKRTELAGQTEFVQTNLGQLVIDLDMLAPSVNFTVSFGPAIILALKCILPPMSSPRLYLSVAG
jgi:hypothetical protein